MTGWLPPTSWYSAGWMRSPRHAPMGRRCGPAPVVRSIVRASMRCSCTAKPMRRCTGRKPVAAASWSATAASTSDVRSPPQQPATAPASIRSDGRRCAAEGVRDPRHSALRLPRVAEFQEHAAAAVEQVDAVVGEGAVRITGVDRTAWVELVRIQKLRCDVARTLGHRLRVQGLVALDLAGLHRQAQTLARIELPADTAVDHHCIERGAAIAFQALMGMVEVEIDAATDVERQPRFPDLAAAHARSSQVEHV